MKFTLNPYTLVINTNGVYNFFLSDHKNPQRLAPNYVQLQVLEQLNNGAFYDYEYLCKVFGQEFTEGLMKRGCLVPAEIDTQSMFSRTNAFFLTHNMPQARERIAGKKVLILGCGGIGTHMAWHMATLGVNQITLVDFDTVEISNLNRQLLFDRSDAGKIKADVLKAKLEAINPYIRVGTIRCKISSEAELEAICLSDKYDLIIKALDSPAQFPLWLDNVAKRHSLTYIAGITMRENVLIGPSFIPGKSTHGWSDLMGLGANAGEKVFGTAPSLGIMLYHISDELAVEAFKILSGYGKLKYTDRILCKNVITDEEQYIRKDRSEKMSSLKNNVSSGTALAVNFILMAILALAETQISWFIPVALLLAMATPFLLYRSNRDVVRCTFINATVIAFGVLIRCLSFVDTSSVTALVSSAALLFSVHSAATLFTCVINYFIHKAFCKQKI